MKTKTLIILFALVMVLSLSAGVYAQDFTETWDEETVLTVFSDLDIVFPDMFADIDSDFLWEDGPSAYPNLFPRGADGEFEAKAPIEDKEYEGKFTFDPCGDGLVKFSATLDREAFVEGTDETPTYPDKYGPEKTSYIREITATIDGNPADIKKCKAKGEEDCSKIVFNKDGQAKISGYLYYPDVLTRDDGDATAGDGSGLEVEMTIAFSNYPSALWAWDVPEAEVTVTGTLVANEKRNYCQESLDETTMAGVYSIRAKYDENTGEARFQAMVRNFAQESNHEGHYKAKQNYVIPADIIIPDWEKDEEGNDTDVEIVLGRYTDYTCKYTVYNNANGAPRTDYCKFGEGIALAPNALIRFDITIDHLDGAVLREYSDGSNIPFKFRVGGMTYLVGTEGNAAEVDHLSYDGYYGMTEGDDPFYAAFVAVDYPCPVVSRMKVMDPLVPFMTFYRMVDDSPIEPSGAYGVYDGGLWGLYQKCGKYAYMAVRLMNDGVQDEVIDLTKTAAAINGGTPMSWKWVLSTIDPYKNKIVLEPGDDVILFGRAKVTDYGYQMNSDQAITGAVNFLDYGFYIQGKVYSDHNNTNCTVAP